MKQITHFLTPAGGILLGSVALALADPVTFQVNMSVQTALGNFNAGNGDTLLVAGNWDNWATTHVMSATANPDVYALTLNLTANTYPNYKFVINPGGTATGNQLKWEAPASFGGGNRWFQVPPGGTNLPVVFFSDATNLPSYQVSLTFQVNMAAAVTLGIFTVGSDYVDAFGSFDGWGMTGVLLTNVPGTSNYMGTLVTGALTTNNTLVSYKYAIDGYNGTWEGNVGTNGAADRSLTLTNTVQVGPLDLWNNITNAGVSYNVQFQVDMIVEDALGNFTPGSDAVYVNGDWSWSGSAVQLTQSATDPDLYSGAVALPFSPGTTINYKYTIDGGLIWENNGVGPGGADNHQFMLAGNTNLPADFFNNYSNLGPLTITPEGAQTALAWAAGTNANNRIRLQTATNLLHGWSDVPGSVGQSSLTNDFGPGPMFFRLTGP